MATNNGLIQLRDDFTKAGYNVGWDPTNGQASINGKNINTNGLQNINGNFYGTYDQLSAIKNQVSNANTNQLKNTVTATPTPTSTPTATPEPVQQPQQQQNIPQHATDTYNRMAAPPPQMVSREGEISQMYEQQKASQIAALKSAIEKNKSQYNQQIQEAPAHFRPLKDQADFQGAKNTNYIREMMANQGLSNSGDNITAQVQSRTSTENNLNSINMQQQKVITDANRAILDLESQGRLDEAKIVADNAFARLQAIIQEQNRVESGNYDRGQDYNSNLLQASQYRSNEEDRMITNNRNSILDARNTETYELEKQDRLRNQYQDSIQGLGNQFDYQAEINKIRDDGDTTNDWKLPMLTQEREKKVEKNLQNEIKTIGQFNNDYQAEINRRMESNPNDPLIPYLKVARMEKLATIQANELTAQEANEKRALDIFKEVGIVTAEIAGILGLPIGTTTTQYQKMLSDIASNKDASARGWASVNIARQNANTATTRANNAANNSAKSQGGDEVLQGIVSALSEKTSAEAYKELKDHSSAFINDLGGDTKAVDVYNKLLTAYGKANATSGSSFDFDLGNMDDILNVR